MRRSARTAVRELPWSPWVPFTATKEEFRQIPKEPGLYRIKPAGKDFLIFIGETRRTTHERLKRTPPHNNTHRPDAVERSPYDHPLALGLAGC
ncbi:MAG: hypothetical protein NTZ37_06290 [Methanoregula sp.]|nr:hypothetical protein [Methanoregula sp.]